MTGHAEDGDFDGLHRYDELKSFLRNWSSLSGPEVYDVVGMFHLLRACLGNLQEFALDAELDDLMECLEPPEREMILRLAECIRSAEPGSGGTGEG